MDDVATAQETAPADEGWEWMFLEIMGHRNHWGRTREEERFGTKMLRIDVPVKGDPSVHGWTTHFYGGAAIFSITLTDEATAMLKNMPWDAPARLQYARPPSIEPAISLDPHPIIDTDIPEAAPPPVDPNVIHDDDMLF